GRWASAPTAATSGPPSSAAFWRRPGCTSSWPTWTRRRPVSTRSSTNLPPWRKPSFSPAVRFGCSPHPSPIRSLPMAQTKQGEQRAAAPAADWAKYFEAAKVRVEELNACKSARARAIWIGKYLSPLVDREVAVEVKGRTGHAVLQVEEGRSNEKRYIFE